MGMAEKTATDVLERMALVLGLPFTHKSPFSESLTSQMQGSFLKQWLFHCKRAQRRQVAGQRLAQRESFQTSHTCVAALANGTTIVFAPRLGLTRLEGF